MHPNDTEFLDQFEQCTLPQGQWNHHAHVRVAFLYLSRHGLETGIARLRERIRAYNAAVGISETQTSGYHETTTVAFATVVDAVLRGHDPRASIHSSDEFCDLHPELLNKYLLFLYYSRKRLALPTARIRFLEPDIGPLPYASSLMRCT